MSLPLPLAAANALFSQPVMAYDVTITTVDGRPQRVTGSVYTVYGTIQTDKGKEVALDPDGALSDGTLMLHTKFVLNQADLNQPTGQQDVQTYVLFYGETWKVNQLYDRHETRQNVYGYRLTKYTNIDVAAV